MEPEINRIQISIKDSNLDFLEIVEGVNVRRIPIIENGSLLKNFGLGIRLKNWRKRESADKRCGKNHP
jgi:hypothetical protein